jgi:uncharacterized protein (TIGR02145 family)
LTTDIQNICPEGWHIPSQQEWADLLYANGGQKVAGAALKESTEMYWRKSDFERNNQSGMTILPAGTRDSKPSFANLGKYSIYWTSTPNPKIPGSFYDVDFGFMRENVTIKPGDPEWSYSIRCVKELKK